MLGVVRESDVDAAVGGPAVFKSAKVPLQTGLVKDAASQLGEVLTDEVVLAVFSSVIQLPAHVVGRELHDDGADLLRAWFPNTVGPADGLRWDVNTDRAGILPDKHVCVLTRSLRHDLTPDTERILSAILLKLVSGILELIDVSFKTCHLLRQLSDLLVFKHELAFQWFH